MYASLYMRNFRSFHDAYMSFRNKKGSIKPIVAVFGNNGIGKTSLLMAFSFLKQSCDHIYYNSMLEQQTDSALRPFNLQFSVSEHFRTGASGPMHLIYECVLEKTIYVYEILFDSEYRLISESLSYKMNHDYNILFKRDRKNIYIYPGMISKKNDETVRKHFLKYRDSATLLSVLFYSEKNDGVHIKKTLHRFIKFVSLQHIDHDNFIHQQHFNILEQRKINVYEGSMGMRDRLFLEASAFAVEKVLKTMQSNVHKIKYEYTKNKTKKDYYDYKMKIYIKTETGIQMIKHSMIPRSAFKLMQLCNVLLDAYLGNQVILDDFTDGLQHEVSKALIEFFIAKASSQIFLTMNHIDIMNELDRKSIYIFVKEASSLNLQCIDDISSVRENHNLRLRYETGVYDDHSIEKDPYAYRELTKLDEAVESMLLKFLHRDQ